MNQPLVSVLMPVYNAGPYLEEAVAGILKQTFTDFELVVVDDGSTDGSSDALARWAAQDKRIHVIRQANGGLLSALNAGLRDVHGQYIARMDADDVSLAQRFEEQARYLNEHPECVAVGSRVLCITPDGLPVTEDFRLTSHQEIDASNLQGRTAMAHPSVMIRHSALKQVGPYRGAFSEDLDMWLRLGEVGRLANLPEVLLKYRLNPNSLSFSKHYRNDEIHWNFVAQAWRRRGLSGQPPRPALPAAGESSLSKMNAFWSRAALHGENYRTARILSRRALRQSPADPTILATAALAHLGPVGRTILKKRI